MMFANAEKLGKCSYLWHFYTFALIKYLPYYQNHKLGFMAMSGGVLFFTHSVCKSLTTPKMHIFTTHRLKNVSASRSLDFKLPGTAEKILITIRPLKTIIRSGGFFLLKVSFVVKAVSCIRIWSSSAIRSLLYSLHAFYRERIDVWYNIAAIYRLHDVVCERCEIQLCEKCFRWLQTWLRSLLIN